MCAHWAVIGQWQPDWPGAVIGRYLLGQLQLGPVGPLPGLQPHEVGDGRVQEVEQRGGQDGHVHVLPLEGEEQRGHALRHRHQPLVVWRTQRRRITYRHTHHVMLCYVEQ